MRSRRNWDRILGTILSGRTHPLRRRLPSRPGRANGPDLANPGKRFPSSHLPQLIAEAQESRRRDGDQDNECAHLFPHTARPKPPWVAWKNTTTKVGCIGVRNFALRIVLSFRRLVAARVRAATSGKSISLQRSFWISPHTRFFAPPFPWPPKPGRGFVLPSCCQDSRPCCDHR